ncbi:MAG: GNAT family N-acetyltransferase [Flavobacteriales bacterium]|nr:GNAT family N-acetyltransferase [Flavobacteriales bacterium]
MLELDFSDFPQLTTQRLQLRRMTLNDAPALFRMRNDANVMRYMGRPRAERMEDVLVLFDTMEKDLSANEGITWAITLKGTDEVLGTVGFYRLKKAHHRGEVGYVLHSDHWRKGYMREALAAAVNCGFDRFRFHSIEAETDPRNVASNTVLERCGFIREGYFRQNFLSHGEFQDSAVYSILGTDPRP